MRGAFDHFPSFGEPSSLGGRLSRKGVWLAIGAIAALATLSLVASAGEAESKPLDADRSDPRVETSLAKTPGLDARSTPRRAGNKRRIVATMREGGGVRGPYGYERFCASDPRYCAPPAKRRPGAMVAASRDVLRQLEAFNRGVNHEFEPNDDMAVHGVADHWTFPTVFADCEDYVLTKQARLIAAGWPREALLIGVVVGEESPYHAVLIVRTSEGELVLDNMTDEVRDWRDTGYTWVIRQSTKYPERWVQVLPNG